MCRGGGDSRQRLRHTGVSLISTTGLAGLCWRRWGIFLLSGGHYSGHLYE
ncbi:hypothetical protein [Aliamphritea spongicola]|nr:hypothetical protein [Aliamphritea spongicola]